MRLLIAAGSIQKLVETLSTVREDCRMALDDEWDRGDEGFEATKDLIDATLAEVCPDLIGREA